MNNRVKLPQKWVSWTPVFRKAPSERPNYEDMSMVVGFKLKGLSLPEGLMEETLTNYRIEAPAMLPANLWNLDETENPIMDVYMIFPTDEEAVAFKLEYL